MFDTHHWLCSYLYFLYLFSCFAATPFPHTDHWRTILFHTPHSVSFSNTGNSFMCFSDTLKSISEGCQNRQRDGWMERQTDGDAEGVRSQMGTHWQLCVMVAITVSLHHHSPFHNKRDQIYMLLASCSNMCNDALFLHNIFRMMVITVLQYAYIMNPVRLTAAWSAMNPGVQVTNW